MHFDPQIFVVIAGIVHLAAWIGILLWHHRGEA